MSNAISYALSNIKFTIPMPLLQKAFVDPSYFGFHTYSIDEAIINNVFKSRIIPDCNAVGGQTIFVDVSKCVSNVIDSGSRVIKVPKSETAGRSIVSVINVTHVTAGLLAALSNSTPASANGQQVGGQCGTDKGTPLHQAMTNLYNSSNSLPVISTAQTEIIGENVIAVRNLPMTMSPSFGLLVVVANEENMSNINYRSLPDFAQLCILATKAYIYNKLIIETDIGQFKAGAVLGTFKNILDTYSDASEQYYDMLRNKWTKVAFTNDKFRYNRFIARTTGAR